MNVRRKSAVREPAGRDTSRPLGGRFEVRLQGIMDAHDSVRAKVDAIFRELAGDRASALLGDVPARRANDILGQALSSDHELLRADEMAFHLVDWNSDAAFLVAFLLYPERFTPEELCAGVDLLLIHVPAHVIAAARLGGYEVQDIFEGDDAT